MNLAGDLVIYHVKLDNRLLEEDEKEFLQVSKVLYQSCKIGKVMNNYWNILLYVHLC